MEKIIGLIGCLLLAGAVAATPNEAADAGTTSDINRNQLSAIE